MNSCQQAFPVKLIEIINEIREEVIPVPTIFDPTEEATEKNCMILKKYDFDLKKAINA
jgi:hypothetical protein